MPDSADLPTFVTLVTFLGVMVFLILLIPPQYFIADPSQYRSIEIPPQFESIDVQYFADTENATVPKDWGTPHDYDLGGWSFWMQGDYSDGWIQHQRHYVRWLINWKFIQMDWYSTQNVKIGDEINCTIIDLYYSLGSNCSKFIVKDDAVQMIIFFNWNTNLYTDSADAWNNDALYFLACINFDQQNTGMNAWALLGMLLFFKLPDVHWIINGIIAIPIWVITVYLIVNAVLKFIEALPFT